MPGTSWLLIYLPTLAFFSIAAAIVYQATKRTKNRLTGRTKLNKLERIKHLDSELQQNRKLGKDKLSNYEDINAYGFFRRFRRKNKTGFLSYRAKNRRMRKQEKLVKWAKKHGLNYDAPYYQGSVRSYVPLKHTEYNGERLNIKHRGNFNKEKTFSQMKMSKKDGSYVKTENKQVIDYFVRLETSEKFAKGKKNDFPKQLAIYSNAESKNKQRGASEKISSRDDFMYYSAAVHIIEGILSSSPNSAYPVTMEETTDKHNYTSTKYSKKDLEIKLKDYKLKAMSAGESYLGKKAYTKSYDDLKDDFEQIL